MNESNLASEEDEHKLDLHYKISVYPQNVLKMMFP